VNALTEIVLGGPVAPWKAIGLAFDEANSLITRIGTIRMCWSSNEPAGIRSLATLHGPSHIDGVAWMTSAPEAGEQDRMPPDSLGSIAIDHVVWMTNDLERTCSAIEAGLGEPLKRVREVGGGIRQGFFRLGEAILEVVGNPKLAPMTSQLWGLVINVSDIDAVAERLGPLVISTPREAVQRGRSIATFTSAANLGTAVALMSP
jgi:hypothetical protein